uniref:Uncharacterized protein n=1 Tax=Panagrellus redivivus TaxID=6233 RepID=A0A7E4VAN7_PANRE
MHGQTDYDAGAVDAVLPDPPTCCCRLERMSPKCASCPPGKAAKNATMHWRQNATFRVGRKRKVVSDIRIWNVIIDGVRSREFEGFDLLEVVNDLLPSPDDK